MCITLWKHQHPCCAWERTKSKTPLSQERSVVLCVLQLVPNFESYSPRQQEKKKVLYKEYTQ